MFDYEKQFTLYLVRHGETIGNTQKIVLHADDDVLNEQGKIQASLLGDALKDIQFTKVCTSQYPRTKETAELILSKNRYPITSSDFEVDSRLREVDINSFIGRPYGELLQKVIDFLKSGKDLDDFSLLDSESIPLMRERAKGFAKDLFHACFKETSPQTVLVVAHGLINRILMEYFTLSMEVEVVGSGSLVSSANKIMRNTSYMKLLFGRKADGGKIHVECKELHQVAHMSKEMLENDSLTRLAHSPQGQCLSGCFQV